MKKLYAIYTVNNFMDMIYRPFAQGLEKRHDDVKVYNIMDDSLLADTRTYGGMTPKIASRMLNYAKAAEESGADAVIVTCTSVNAATKMIRPLLSIPIINIEEPVAEQAVETGKRIGVIGTIPTSPEAIGRVIREKAAEKNKEIEIINRVADGAFDAYCDGDMEKHDEMVRKALYDLAKEVDVVVFAQISMSMVKHDPVDVPVCKIGDSGFERIYSLMDKCK